MAEAMLSAAQSFPCEPSAVAASRRWVADVLSMWRTPSSTIDDVVLLVSELATNAVEHARSRFTVSISESELRFRVSVEDRDPRRPSLRRSGVVDLRGHGLQLVDALSHAWGTESIEGDGKLVWFEVWA